MKKPALIAGTLLIIPAAVMVYRTAFAETSTETSESEPVAAHSSPAVAATEVTEEPEEVKKEKKEIIVTVKPGESLLSIAKAHNLSLQRLFDANKSISDPNLIKPGDKIRIPDPDEELKHREIPKPKPLVKSSATVEPKPKKKSLSSSAPAVASGSVWDQMAACESGGNWSLSTGNGYYGGLQFSAATWRAVGGQGLPHENSREEQILRGKMLQSRSGWGQWPHCASKLGLI